MFTKLMFMKTSMFNKVGEQKPLSATVKSRKLRVCGVDILTGNITMHGRRMKTKRKTEEMLVRKHKRMDWQTLTYYPEGHKKLVIFC